MRILSLNIWGAPYAKDRAARLGAITDEIKRLNPDVIVLQEVFLPGQRQHFIEALAPIYNYSHYFYSGVIGSGLLTLSRYPIVDAIFHRFRLGGKPERLQHGDYFAGKGIGLTRIDAPEGLYNVFNSHTHAQYQEQDTDEYAIFTDSNLYEAARFINAYADDNPTILCGDLNTQPDQTGYRIITTLANLADAYLEQHAAHPVTFSAQNPYTGHDDQCLDYILLRNAQSSTITRCMTEHFTGAYLAYSDHYGLLADVQPAAPISTTPDAQPVLAALQQRLSLALAEIEGEQITYLERAAIAAGGTIDVTFLLRPILRRIVPARSARFQRWIIIVLLLFAGGQLLHTGINLRARRNVLQALHDEITTQLL